ncbi:MAG: FHIPEP family type III secretion protein, partial [Syntrophomonadaceae bacterium]|nr:FHIPEP family type III secretion protein [Syntrophomonadaceae bacterium]
MEERAGFLNQFIGRSSDILVALLVVCIVMMMIIPLNPSLLDILLTFNISFGLIILMVSMFNTDP